MGNKTGKIFEKIVNVLLDIVLGLFGILLVILIYQNIQIHILGNKYSSFFGYTTFEVKTGSMEPTISAGDWILVKKEKEIKLKDIITFEQDGNFITHRVVQSYKDTYVTQGDANNDTDSSINKSQIVGKVIKVFPSFGIIRKTILNPPVLIALIITLYIFSYALTTTNRSNIGKEKTLRTSLDSYVTSFLRKLIKKNKEKQKQRKVEFIDSDDNIFDEKPNKNKKEEVYEQTEELEETIEKIEEDEVATEIIEEAPSKEENLTEKDMDNTMYFRMVNVSINELDETYKKIAINEQFMPKEEDEIEEEVKQKDDEVEKTKQILQNKKKKFENIIDKVMFIKREEITELVNLLNTKNKFANGESTINKTLLNAYIDVKYYNFCGNENVEYTSKNMISKIDSLLKSKKEELLKTYKGTDKSYPEKVEKFIKYYCLINTLEQIYNITEKIDDKRLSYTDKINKALKGTYNEQELKTLINKMIKVQKVYSQIINEIITNTDTNTFELVYKTLDSKKNIYKLSLNHNIEFSKIYSDYIVDKTYTEGSIAEEKVMVTLNLLLVRLIKDMFSSTTGNKYIVEIPSTIYTKPNKVKKITSLLEDEYAKNNVFLLVSYDNLLDPKKVLRELKKDGYRFALEHQETDEINDKTNKNMTIVDYVIFNKKSAKNKVLLSNVPDTLKENTIIEGNTRSKRVKK